MQRSFTSKASGLSPELVGCLGFSMILSNNLNIQFRENGRVGITAVLHDCRKGEAELWGLNVTRHLPTRGKKIGKCC